VRCVRLQVQLLSDNQRGATLEAVVSRMKTIHSLNAAELKQTSADCPGIRFIAVSATIPNVSDVRPLASLAGNTHEQFLKFTVGLGFLLI